MSDINEIKKEIQGILKTKWNARDGRAIPDAEDIALGNDAVNLDATVLYADLVDSTNLATGFKDWFAAEIYKTYLVGACRVIQNNGGEITAFDGDRIMAVFIGDLKNSSAAKTALQISYLVLNVINPEIKNNYPNTSYQLKQAVGIDTGKLFVAKTGIRNNNDLVWVGRAPNYAAKLCDIRDGVYSSFITEDVFNRLRDDVKYGGQPRRLMWEKAIWTELGIVIYKSNWTHTI